jgi:serine/threonine-protein phosphatase 4 regulatory subunit 1
LLVSTPIQLPLFHSLQSDVNLHVRYSSVFALPAILSRLSPDHRRSLALEIIVSLSSDENEIVRSGALEVLGEVLHTFQNDRTGPPKQLVHLFLGRKEDKRVRDGQQQMPPAGNDPVESFYRDPGRPLTCAFNFPAVALTLGASRWDELRDAYVDIASNRSSKVRRTLAASLGKMAEIIGQKFAQRDLISVWWDAIRCEEEEVRTKVVESSDVLIGVIGEAAGATLLQGLLKVWEEGVFKGWRERDAIAKRLLTFAHMLGEAISSSISGLLLRALEDDVAAVRETAISMVSAQFLF